ncbi:cytochrome P450 [Lactarius hengduanensis]|nr:cytochrome P450 [Lactarius hengduanensis]
MTDLTAILCTLSAGFSLVAFYTLVVVADLSGTSEDQLHLRFGWVWCPNSSPRNEADIRYQDEVGDCEFKWMREYGKCVASDWMPWWSQTDRLMVADPKASKHILHSAGYHYPKTIDRAQFIRLLAGNGLVAAEGQAHHRQRKIMTPAFGTHQLVQKWKEVIAADPSGQPLVNVVGWFSRASLDIIGEAGFDFQFGSLDNLANPVVLRNDEEFVDSMVYPSWYDLVFKGHGNTSRDHCLNMSRYIPTREYRGFRSWLDNVHRVRHSMATLYIAYWCADNTTFLSAGHETTAKALTWYFYAIAKHPEAQVRIREEIALVRARATGEEFTIADLDSMAYTLATLKVVVDFTYLCESMRLDPIVWYTSRVASRDDILPLAFPITTKSGQQITSIPIKKGTPIDISPAVYNRLVAEREHRLPDVWGEDANEWNPERFLDPLRGFKEASSNIGVFGSLMSFSTGTRGCIGWEFAVLEMQIIILALVENFEFSLPPQNEKTRIYRRPTHVMMPMREGQKGTWMGLHIKPLN